MLKKIIRKVIKKVLTGSEGIVLSSDYPDIGKINLEKLGIYLHVPFCRHPCFYCPYFKEKYNRKDAVDYSNAVVKEVEFYKNIMGNADITSFYIGGGTPTTMVGSGLEEIIGAIKQSFSLKCGISTETHPDDITPSMVEKLKGMGVENVSMGVESFNDRFLEIIGRTYRSDRARDAVSVLVESGFKCVNIDLMFGLPNQEVKDVEKDIQTAIKLGVDQISAYPIFTFPHTKLEEVVRKKGYSLPGIMKRRAMLKKIEELCYNAGMERTSVWAFTKKGVRKYSSVTVPKYIGIGAGAGSLVPGSFFINTFSVEEYIKFLERRGKPPVALHIDFGEMDEMLHWLYWRIYETKIIKKEFEEQFGRDFDDIFKRIFRLFRMLGMARDEGDRIVMTDRGNYWIHVLQNVFSLDFIGRVWNICLADKWPNEIELI